MTKFTKTLLASLVSLSAAGANAAAFQLAEVSTSGLGAAYAGNAAVANDASVIATNPALMTQFKQTEISVGGVLVDGKVDVTGTMGTTLNGNYVALADASHKNVIPRGFIPNLYVVAPINERFAIGGGMNVNYGLKSKYNPDYNAGIFGGNTELKAINLNLSGAYNLGYGFSLGAGLNAIYSQAEVIRHLGVSGKALAQRLNTAAQNPRLAPLAAQLNTAAATLAQMQNGTEISRLSGDEWSFGWNAGLSYDINERNRIGVAYHSAVNVKFKGDYSNAFPTQFNPLINQLSAMGVALPLSQATGGERIPGRLTLHLPAYWEISTYHKLTDKFAMQFSYKRTEWSKFKKLEAYGQSGNVLFSKAENYSDSSRIAIGASYDVSEALTLRAGLAHDENASINNPSISIPDTDRTWYSLGATYRFTPNLSTDIGFTHLRGSKNRFNEDGRGVFEVKSKANLYGLNINYKF
ncbi:membrane protein [[Actinobacillus] muris]|uniref:Membrane protein n=1 Tax=Muribacter muris TaxID=67855 RepID=A0A0J5P7I4_9PAST|nr:porin [Muribacter muris]KMK52201.1 membrane protein [[Actinobacillus] muris] [Muribacter muris]